MAIGASAIKKLLAKGIQPIRVDEVDAVDELLGQISKAMSEGGVVWIDRAIAAQAKAKEENRFASMEEEGWEG
jgi:nitrogen fixation protein NifX